ncbi:hypothetical protein AAFF_G00398620 [Aldrovandia affinis]|uniref:Reverse transcriptase/retrotransposon-derived protein RNase H-like domain-containing protein n=1 Tax=Aldrovandia affinis TaxID=143900 RepID=A0AAD7WKH1_9TELE|nr:hypothetical protein AAFF_G00398620 [Aldrovandia affinis]
MALKEALCEAPVLATPGPLRPFILDTDASDEGLGAVLSQATTDGERCQHCVLMLGKQKTNWPSGRDAECCYLLTPLSGRYTRKVYIRDPDLKMVM